MRTSIYLIISLFLFSCAEPSSADLIAENKAEAEAIFDHFYACYEIAKNTPEIQHDEIKWQKNDATTKLGERNVFQIGIESFKDLAEPLDVPLDGTRRREHVDMAHLFDLDLSAHQEPHNYNIDTKYSMHEVESEYSYDAINSFLNTKYLLINRLLDNAQPYALDSETYAAGYVRGDVLVFDLASEQLLGGFKIEAKSKDQMTLKEYSDLSSNLMADLGMRAYGLIKERFADLTPSIESSAFEF